MLKITRKAGSTDVSVVLEIMDSTDGTPETGVVFNTAGIDIKYRREGAANVDITEVTLAALTTAHTDGGFLHIGNGCYRLDLPDAAVAAGVSGVLIHGTVTGMIIIPVYIDLVAYDPLDTVRLGLTALPNSVTMAVLQGTAVRGTVDYTGFAATATQFEADDITEATANHYLGRSVYPTSGALLGQCIGTITAYVLTSGRGHFTVSGSPSAEAMADNATFIIV